MTKPFHTSLLPMKSDICGGYGTGEIDPSRLADDLFGAEVPGPWLCCYMLRRFGWPNTGSDDYKQLCTWTLATPIPGLYLGVTPYLGSSNLHFSVAFNKAVGDKLSGDPGREHYRARFNEALLRWWDSKGCELYIFGQGKAQGDEDTLVCAFDEPKDGMVWGLWTRTPKHPKSKKSKTFPAGLLWWLSEFVSEDHPEVRLPKMNAREWAARHTRFQKAAQAAIRATLKDLLRPTNVRDISFTPFGNIEKTPEAISHYKNQQHADYFGGAGYAPEYWFANAAKIRAERDKKSA